MLRPRRFLILAALLWSVTVPGLSALDHGETAPDFKLPGVGAHSSPVHLEDFRGKVVLLDFWATWCAPCIQSLPELEEIARKFSGQPFAMVSVSIDRNGEALRKFLAKHPAPWSMAWDEQSELARSYGIHGFPTFLLLDRDGKVLRQVTGWGPGRLPRDVTPAIEKALQEKH
jgi:thiol-disulfide isomerase/thioredoxin